jgi:2-succinyl-5-enolpyruvyl-6-hydroxy-3-cyclohexene-1-carboxylate synthase
VALMIGDLSFFHDLNGLWPLRRYGLDLTVLLVNNDGGGIFSFLPQRQAVPAQFEEWFGTPSGLDFAHAIALHGGTHTLLDGGDWRALPVALTRPGLNVLELRTDRDRNVELHQQVWSRVCQVVRDATAAAAAVGG